MDMFLNVKDEKVWYGHLTIIVIRLYYDFHTTYIISIPYHNHTTAYTICLVQCIMLNIHYVTYHIKFTQCHKKVPKNDVTKKSIAHF